MASNFFKRRLRLKTPFRVFCLVLVFAWLAGCVTMGEVRRMKRFEQAEQAYRLLINLSELESAAKWVEPSWKMAHPLNFESLHRYRVTEYDIKNVTVLEEAGQVVQEVEIRYYRTDQVIEKQFRHLTEWRFDDETGIWLISNGLPPFQ